MRPFTVTGTLNAYDIRCYAHGGGKSGQCGAVQLALARAILASHPHPEIKKTLRKTGLLTRDPRMVERKKPGQKKARKKFAWVKR